MQGVLPFKKHVFSFLGIILAEGEIEGEVTCNWLENSFEHFS